MLYLFIFLLCAKNNPKPLELEAHVLFSEEAEQQISHSLIDPIGRAQHIFRKDIDLSKTHRQNKVY